VRESVKEKKVQKRYDEEFKRQYVSAAFGSLDQPWKPGHLRSAYAAICCHRFKPRNMTDDIFLALILGHKALAGRCSVVGGAELQGFLCRRRLKTARNEQNTPGYHRERGQAPRWVASRAETKIMPIQATRQQGS